MLIDLCQPRLGGCKSFEKAHQHKTYPSAILAPVLFVSPGENFSGSRGSKFDCSSDAGSSGGGGSRVQVMLRKLCLLRADSLLALNDEAKEM